MMTISIMKSILETISFDAQGTAYVKYYEQFSVRVDRKTGEITKADFGFKS